LSAKSNGAACVCKRLTDETPLAHTHGTVPILRDFIWNKETKPMTQKKHIYLSKAALIAAVALSTCILLRPQAWAQG
jgi:hypothetical protein